MAIPFQLDKTITNIEWHRSCGSKTMGMMVAALCAVLRATSAIEIGIANGFTTQCLAYGMCAYAKLPVLVSCDINPQCCQISRDATRDLPIKHQVVCADSNEVDWALLLNREGRTTIDIAVIDGEHTGKTPYHDITAVAKLLAPNGCIFVHDCAPGMPDVLEAVMRFRRESGWQMLFLPEHPGVGDYAAAIIQKPNEGNWGIKTNEVQI